MNKRRFWKSKFICYTAILLLAVSPSVVYADEVTDFENWTPNANGDGGYTNSSGQTGVDGSSDVHVKDEGSGKSESSSSSTESGKVINTETNKEASVTITTTETSGSTQDITNVGNGQMVPVVEKEESVRQDIEGSNANNAENGMINNDNNGYIENPKNDPPNAPNSTGNPNNANDQGGGKGGNPENSDNHTNGKPSSPMVPWVPKEESVWDKYGNHWGKSTAESIESVTVTEDGKWLVKYRYEDGTESSLSFDTVEDYTFVLTGVKNEKGEKTEKEFRFTRSDELTEWIFKYYLWRAVNLSFKTSSYYGTGKNVAKTTQSNAVFTLDEAGKYRVLATPYHDVRHYHIYEWEDDDGSHSEEITDYWEYDRTKSPDIYSVVIPIITGDPVKVCVNGGCDCDTDLNAVCDEANEPVYDIQNRVELEK